MDGYKILKVKKVILCKPGKIKVYNGAGQVAMLSYFKNSFKNAKDFFSHCKFSLVYSRKSSKKSKKKFMLQPGTRKVQNIACFNVYYTYRLFLIQF